MWTEWGISKNSDKWGSTHKSDDWKTCRGGQKTPRNTGKQTGRRQERQEVSAEPRRSPRGRSIRSEEGWVYGWSTPDLEKVGKTWPIHCAYRPREETDEQKEYTAKGLNDSQTAFLVRKWVSIFSYILKCRNKTMTESAHKTYNKRKVNRIDWVAQTCPDSPSVIKSPGLTKGASRVSEAARPGTRVSAAGDSLPRCMDMMSQQ